MAVASSNAILNVGRLNAFRLNYLEAGLKRRRDRLLTITFNGTPVRVRLGSLQIHDVINDTPNTCTFILDDQPTQPVRGTRVKVVLGVDPQYTLFVGGLQAVDESYVGRSTLSPVVRAWRCEALDDTGRADWQRPFGAWEGVSATTVAQQIVASFCEGYTTAHVEAGLPPITLYLDGTERVNGALRLIAKLIGGYYYFENYDLHLFQGDEQGIANPDDVTGAPGQLLDDPPIATTTDDSQIRTRCYGKGHAEATISAVLANDTTIPLANTVMFNPAGGKAISEWQRLTYTGTAIGGAGALVGPGVTPSAPPVAALAAGTGVDPGSHAYAYTWKTAAGETLPSPLGGITVSAGSVTRPTVAPTFLGHGGPTGTGNVDPLQTGAWKPGDTVEIGYSHATTHTDLATFTPMGPTISVIAQPSPYYFHTPGDAAKSLYISLPYSSDPQVKYLTAWHRVNGGPWRYWAGPENHPEYLSPFNWTLDNPSYYTLAGTPPATDITYRRVAVSGISVGPGAITDRWLYRSKAGTTAPLYFVGGISGNVVTTFTDTVADSAGTLVAPTADTSGLQQPAGQVLPGAAALPVSGAGWARAAGGWVVIGNGQQVIRYTGIAGNQLTGIPASGPGAIVAAVTYNSTVTGAPMLLGVGGLTRPLVLGAPVNIWVQVDSQQEQAAYGARTGGSGIVEHLIVDERRGEASLTALCTADLMIYSRAIVTCRYTTFDPKSRSGRPVKMALASPPIGTMLTIQDVTIDPGDGNTTPRFHVIASTIFYSFEDLLRRMAVTLEEGF